MYSSSYLIFVGKQQLPSEFHTIIEKLSEIIPATGILNLTPLELANELSTSVVVVNELFLLLNNCRPKLIECENNCFIFNYAPKEIDYVNHLRNALSNFNFEQQEFL